MKVEKNVSLKNFSTFKVGGKAKFFCRAESLTELREALKWAESKKEKVFILGGGSNLLFLDDGFDGLVIKIKNEELKIKNQKLKIKDETEVKNCESNNLIGMQAGKDLHHAIQVGAGVSLMELVNFALANDLIGLEWAAGIPGTVGGAIRGNAGAFGGEMKDSIESVTMISRDNLEVTTLKNKDCGFSYRESVFKEDKDKIIWDCVVDLRKGSATEMEKSRSEAKEIIQRRGVKQPSLGSFPSAGSVFKNPVASENLIKEFEKEKGISCRGNKVPAGWLIEMCDLKGKKIGGAMVSPKQANFIVNTGDATAEDIVILISLIKQKVRSIFGVQLREEIEVVG